MLSNLEYRGIFDKYGEYGLKNGVTNHKGEKIGGYMFLGNSEEIYEQYFGKTTPMDDIFEPDGSDIYGSLLGDGFGGKSRVKYNPPTDINLNLKCTLEEFYNGSLKKLTYQRDQIQPNGRSVVKVDEEIVIDVKPGFDVGTALTYPNRGNEQFSFPRSSLIVKLQLDESSPTKFMRKGNDLIYTHSLTLEDALRSVPI